MGFSLLPKEYQFFDMFENLISYAVKAIEHFKDDTLITGFTDESVKKIKEIERAADHVVFDIIQKLNATFITPIDREDIHELAHELDSVVDLILKLANMMKIYKIVEINKSFMHEFELIFTSVLTLRDTVGMMRHLKNTAPIMEGIAKINDLENQGDQLRNEIVGDLFETNDAIYIMKWKDIFTTSEKLLDQCDDAAKIIESILVKQA